MNEYILFMHNDAAGAEDASAWNTYLARLRETDQFDGGSAIGGGVCVTKSGKVSPITTHLDGYIRVRAASIEDARRFVIGNPVYEAGGTVEIRELPRGT
jgi:hypothetical protein